MCIRQNKDGAQLGPNPLLQRQDPRTAFTVHSSRSDVASESAAGTRSCHANFPVIPTRVASNARFCYLHKTHKTKYYVFLLIFLCTIIFQRSSAFPAALSEERRLILHTAEHRLRHHQELLLQHQQEQQQLSKAHHHLHHLQHRSVASTMDARINGGDEGDYNKINNEFCLNSDHLKNMLIQANKTYAYISSILGDYTNSQYKKTPEEVHITWMKHMFQLEHPLTKALERDFYKLPDKQHFTKFLKEPLTKKLVFNEMQNVYTTLKILKSALDDVIKNRRDNKIQLLHDLHNNLANFNKINEFFAEVNKMVKVDMHEVTKFMEKLAIPLPEVDEQIAFHSRTEVRDWLLASEHLSVTQYLRVLYSTLLENCPEMDGE